MKNKKRQVRFYKNNMLLDIVKLKIGRKKLKKSNACCRKPLESSRKHSQVSFKHYFEVGTRVDK